MRGVRASTAPRPSTLTSLSRTRLYVLVMMAISRLTYTMLTVNVKHTNSAVAILGFLLRTMSGCQASQAGAVATRRDADGAARAGVGRVMRAGARVQCWGVASWRWRIGDAHLLRCTGCAGLG